MDGTSSRGKTTHPPSHLLDDCTVSDAIGQRNCELVRSRGPATCWLVSATTTAKRFYFPKKSSSDSSSPTREVPGTFWRRLVSQGGQRIVIRALLGNISEAGNRSRHREPQGGSGAGQTPTSTTWQTFRKRRRNRNDLRGGGKPTMFHRYFPDPEPQQLA